MKKLILASSVAAVGLSSVSAIAAPGDFYINPSIGYLMFDSSRELDDAPLFGAGLEYQFAEQFGLEVSGFMGSTDRTDFNNDTGVDFKMLRLDGLYYLGDFDGIKPYLAAGFGRLDLDMDTSGLTESSYDEDQFNVGGGLRYAINEA